MKCVCASQPNKKRFTDCAKEPVWHLIYVKMLHVVKTMLQYNGKRLKRKNTLL